MSILNTLTEGIVNRDMAKEGQALLNKWSQTGLLEGLQTERQKHSMARLLENQAKELLREGSSMAAGDVEGFAAVAFPIVRRVFAGLIANDLVSVQPMSLPSGLIFFLDFKFEENGASPRMGNVDGKSIYGTNQVGAEVIDGVDLINATSKAGFGGPGRDGSTGYAYASPSGSLSAVLSADAENTALIFTLDGAVTEANKKRIKYDADLLAITDSSQKVVVLDIDPANIVSNDGLADFNNLSAFIGSATGLNTAVSNISANTAVQIRRLSDRVAPANADNTPNTITDHSVRLVYTIPTANATNQAATALDSGFTAAEFTFPLKDSLPAGSAVGSVGSSSNLFPLEGETSIPEINIDVSSTAITAQTKKLKAKWTPELGKT